MIFTNIMQNRLIMDLKNFVFGLPDHFGLPHILLVETYIEKKVEIHIKIKLNKIK